MPMISNQSRGSRRGRRLNSIPWQSPSAVRCLMNLVSSFDTFIHCAADSCVHEAVLTFAHRTMPSWLQDIKRVVVNTHAMDPQQLIEYFGSLSAEWALECLKVQLPCPHPAARSSRNTCLTAPATPSVCVQPEPNASADCCVC